MWSQSQVKVMSLKKMLRDTDRDIITIKSIDGGGFSMDCKNEESGEQWGTNYYGLVAYDSLRNLEGKVLTLIDATFTDKEQRKSVKDIFRRTFWFDWVENHIYRGKDGLPVGMPTISTISSIDDCNPNQ